MERVELAHEYHKNGYNCCQSVLAAFSDITGLSEQASMNIGGGFGGGAGTEEAGLESFNHYTSLIQPGGALIVHRGLRFEERLQEGVRRYDYSRTEGDFHAENIRIGGGRIVFDFVSPFGNIADIELGVPVSINIDNGIAAMALAQLAGADAETIRRAMATYSGVVRRFDFKIRSMTSSSRLRASAKSG